MLLTWRSIKCVEAWRRAASCAGEACAAPRQVPFKAANPSRSSRRRTTTGSSSILRRSTPYSSRRGCGERVAQTSVGALRASLNKLPDRRHALVAELQQNGIGRRRADDLAHDGRPRGLERAHADDVDDGAVRVPQLQVLVGQLPDLFGKLSGAQDGWELAGMYQLRVPRRRWRAQQ